MVAAWHHTFCVDGSKTAALVGETRVIFAAIKAAGNSGKKFLLGAAEISFLLKTCRIKMFATADFFYRSCLVVSKKLAAYLPDAIVFIIVVFAANTGDYGVAGAIEFKVFPRFVEIGTLIGA